MKKFIVMMLILSLAFVGVQAQQPTDAHIFGDVVDARSKEQTPPFYPAAKKPCAQPKHRQVTKKVYKQKKICIEFHSRSVLYGYSVAFRF